MSHGLERRVSEPLVERRVEEEPRLAVEVFEPLRREVGQRDEAGGIRERHQAQVVDPADPGEQELQPRMLRRKIGVGAEPVEGCHRRRGVLLDPAGIHQERELVAARLDARHGERLRSRPVLGRSEQDLGGPPHAHPVPDRSGRIGRDRHEPVEGRVAADAAIHLGQVAGVGLLPLPFESPGHRIQRALGQAAGRQSSRRDPLPAIGHLQVADIQQRADDAGRARREGERAADPLLVLVARVDDDRRREEGGEQARVHEPGDLGERLHRHDVHGVLAAGLPHPAVDEQRRIERGPHLHVAATGRGGDQRLEHRLAVFAATVEAGLAEEQVDEHVRPAVGGEGRDLGGVGGQPLAPRGGRVPLEPGSADRGRLDGRVVSELELPPLRHPRRGDTFLVGDRDPGLVDGEVAGEQAVDRQQELLPVEEGPLIEGPAALRREHRREDEGGALKNRLAERGRLRAAAAQAPELGRPARLPGRPLPLVEFAERRPLAGLVDLVVPGVLVPAVGRDDVGPEHRPGPRRERRQALLHELGIAHDRVVVDHGDEAGPEHVAGMGVADVVALGEAEVFAREQERHVGRGGEQLAGPGDRRRLGAVVDHDDVHPAVAGREPPQRGHAAGRDLGLVELQHHERERLGGLRPRGQHRGRDRRRIGERNDTVPELADGPALIEPEPVAGGRQPRDRRDMLEQEAVRGVGHVTTEQRAEPRPSVLEHGRVSGRHACGRRGGGGRLRHGPPPGGLGHERRRRLLEGRIAVPHVGLEVRSLGPLVPGVDEHELPLGRLLPLHLLDDAPQPAAVERRRGVDPGRGPLHPTGRVVPAGHHAAVERIVGRRSGE